jgi:hypothetical protein
VQRSHALFADVTRVFPQLHPIADEVNNVYMAASTSAAILQEIASDIEANARDLLLATPEVLEHRADHMNQAVRAALGSLSSAPPSEWSHDILAGVRQLGRATAMYRVVLAEAVARANTLLTAARYCRSFDRENEVGPRG